MFNYIMKQKEAYLIKIKCCMSRLFVITSVNTKKPQFMRPLMRYLRVLNKPVYRSSTSSSVQQA
ncbi:hypothetical protein PghCCS26_13730 [Paenibacillus glycanilyticus]|uniref:Uncharacterized protein n=1 Tax=Paenibacillus glycanilyticus TaxID=126569 RepID=A0ABQ6NGM5_9BACL|nr:hypothetical protein PghCCS26_13730 [Paenibacillus glycanilyticus]